MRSLYWILDGHTPVPVEDVVTWGRWFERTENRRVAHDADEGTGWRVSTVFMGLDHSFKETDPPILFETMIFPPKDQPVPVHLHRFDNYQARYATWEEAAVGHAAVMAELREALKLDIFG